jgi:hypothetical protein
MECSQRVVWQKRSSVTWSLTTVLDDEEHDPDVDLYMIRVLLR